MSRLAKYKQRMTFSGNKFILFIIIETIIIIGGTVYLAAISSNISLSLVVLVISVLVSAVMTFIGLLLVRITKIKGIYFILPIILSYPLVSSWIEMVNEEDWVQVLVDFIVLGPLLGGLLISLPMILLFNNEPLKHIKDDKFSGK